MTDTLPPADSAAYDDALRRAHMPAHARRTAGANAAFFLPHLRAGMRLLDCGCGPGSITAGLAEAVAPGAAIGIDASRAAIDAARLVQTDGANLRFAIADAFTLPFPDATFDAVFAHALLQHLPDPLAALREMRRVLEPGGVIGVADADHDGSIIAPHDPLLERSMQLLRDVRERSGGGDPRIGKQLRALLHEAGFVRAAASVTAASDGSDAVTGRTGEWQARYLESPVGGRAIALGLTTDDDLRSMVAAWRAWGAHPGAFWARFWCEAVAFR
jgi:ubiquinone/menaquinone biosynthesis C-methylase UbiE